MVIKSTLEMGLLPELDGRGPCRPQGHGGIGLSQGDRLDLRGGECCFWVVCSSTRWRLKSNPIDIPEGRWTSGPATFLLINDEALWRRSWSNDSSQSTSLTDCLAKCASYLFYFVGFAPQGKPSIGGFDIRNPE